MGAWPGRRARWPTPSEAPPGLGPLLRFTNPSGDRSGGGPGGASPGAPGDDLSAAGAAESSAVTWRRTGGPDVSLGSVRVFEAGSGPLDFIRHLQLVVPDLRRPGGAWGADPVWDAGPALRGGDGPEDCGSRAPGTGEWTAGRGRGLALRRSPRGGAREGLPNHAGVPALRCLVGLSGALD
ncbi:hypothetical protein NDU88_001930 [Pleurodeles waltl]|uniref:Uncharacterized protein n=1 Tax=Pleurodeles waltl TaxID=8319 RepID=A0AAV7M2I0_PLEWA|nr:hypothetical protein NDU88_001930 [Pleurodeles waltl]